MLNLLSTHSDNGSSCDGHWHSATLLCNLPACESQSAVVYQIVSLNEDSAYVCRTSAQLNQIK